MAFSLPLPARPDDALTGSAFVLKAVEAWERSPAHAPFSILLRAREEAMVAAILAGNVPNFLRTFHPVDVSSPGKPALTASLEVAADYLAIGSDDDFVRVPLSPITATLLADSLGCVLPTPKMVDTIYAQSTRQVAIPMPPPSPTMTSLQRAKAHHDKIEAARVGQLGALLAGHKKDVVVARRLAWTAGKVAIYGFFSASQKPFQTLQMPHPDWYSDYSHGIRLVRATMTINGEERPTEKVLTDPTLCRLLTDPGLDPGPFTVTRYKIRPLPQSVSP